MNENSLAAPRVVGLEEIKAATAERALLMGLLEEGFVRFSAGEVSVPPVGHLGIPKAQGECHIKYGMIENDTVFVIKIATGFYANSQLGLSSGNGLFLVFSAKTGAPLAVLLDGGYMTDLRTALAGAICAKYLGPREVCGLGIFGSGLQARLQAEAIGSVTSCRDLHVCARNPERLELYGAEMRSRGWNVRLHAEPRSLLAECNLIVTATASCSPLFAGADLRPGTHVIAMGSDGGGKRELDAETLRRASLVCVDSRKQCLSFGEASYGIAEGCLNEERIVELGEIIRRGENHDSSSEISVSDLTGVAVQDIQIAKHVCCALGLIQA